MKRIIVFLFSIFVVISCKSKVEESQLSGNVINPSDTKVVINLPIDGKFFEGNNVDVPIDNEGNYSLSMTNEVDGLITITNHFSRAFIFSFSKKKYVVNFDNEKVIYDTDEQKIVDLLEKLGLLSDTHNAVDAERYTDIESKNKYYSDLLTEKLKLLDIARKDLVLSDSVYEKLKNLVLLKIADFQSTDYFFTFRLFYENTPEKKNEFLQNYLSKWEEIYQVSFQNPEFSAYNEQSTFLSRYKMMYDIKQTGSLQFGTSAEPYFISEINFFRNNLPPNLLEYAWANMVYQGVSQQQFEREWIDNFEEFKRQFPESKLINLLKPYIDQIIAYNDNSEKSADFVENYQQINSLEELFQQFQGKTLYIDLWATWCVPCRKELQYSKENHHILEEMGVVSIYLSIDRDNADDAWKELVKNLELKGLHLRANSLLSKEISDIVEEIPYYIIVGKDGKKVWKAKRPSDKRELFEQLKLYL